jgi:glycosyltransferase involved in cell wall biosynthesis
MMAGLYPLKNLATIINNFSPCLYIITGEVGKEIQTPGYIIYTIKHFPNKNILMKIIQHINIQLQISWRMIALYNQVHAWIFFLDAHSYSLPVITARILRKKIIFLLAASIKNTNESRQDKITNLLIWSENLNYRFADKIVIYSEGLINKWNLGKYYRKICIARQHFIDINKFKLIKRIEKREKLVGYIGRLSEEKGLINFLKAIIYVIDQDNDITFLIGGDGALKLEAESFIKKNNLQHKVSLIGWIAHEHLPAYLNEIKLLVIPSYSEGLPQIMLEALSCGTPVLATAVGSIPDIIENEKTGYIIENNKPENIAYNILNILNNNNMLDNVSYNSLVMVNNEFTYENTINKWYNIICDNK